MHTSIIILIVTSFALFAAPRTSDAAPKPAKEQQGALYHVVSLKFKESATPEQIKAVEEAFRTLKGKIAEIQTLHWGTNVSPEKHDKGFTHCFVLTFAGAKERDAYLIHPEHKAFGKVLGPVLGDVFVIDFVGKE